jgi:hypothetical protein
MSRLLSILLTVMVVMAGAPFFFFVDEALAKVLTGTAGNDTLVGADMQFPRLKHLWVDAGYRGEDRGKDRVEKKLGWSVELVERPRKSMPQRKRF